MKKILFVLGIFAVLSFTACSATSDCECSWTFEGYPITFDVENYEGDCNDVDWNDIPMYDQGSHDLYMLYLDCTDK
ncbi:MAG: hypothetical protein LBM25_01720 [Bacteroidales bacterium]|jgi:hypothetical protein|nr:hypothetical protein [Bacteroidales bacterium]